MAYVAAGFTLSVTLRDKIGNETNKLYKLTSADHTAAVADTSTIIAALTGLSKAEVLKYTIGTELVNNAVSVPTSDMPISTVVSATTALTTAGKKANWAVPMPEDAAMSGNDLIIANGLVTAYQALFTAGGKATISDGETASGASPLSGRLVTRSRSFD
jgi:hypothetical protein